VFFWVSEDRLEGLLNASHYQGRAHDVIVSDSRQLIERNKDRITLSPINSGAALFNPAKRGRDTFRCIHDYNLDTMTKLKHRSKKDAIVELAVDRAVCDLEAIALRVERRHGSRVQSVVWERSTA
jgi:hypothetical protein